MSNPLATPDRIVLVGEGAGAPDPLPRLSELAGFTAMENVVLDDLVVLQLPRHPFETAVQRAEEMKRHLQGRRVLLLGRRVADAFGLPGMPSMKWLAVPPFEFLAVFPNPSRLNRAWSSAAVRKRAETFLVDAFLVRVLGSARLSRDSARGGD